MTFSRLRLFIQISLSAEFHLLYLSVFRTYRRNLVFVRGIYCHLLIYSNPSVFALTAAAELKTLALALYCD